MRNSEDIAVPEHICIPGERKWDEKKKKRAWVLSLELSRSSSTVYSQNGMACDSSDKNYCDRAGIHSNTLRPLCVANNHPIGIAQPYALSFIWRCCTALAEHRSPRMQVLPWYLDLAKKPCFCPLSWLRLFFSMLVRGKNTRRKRKEVVYTESDWWAAQ